MVLHWCGRHLIWFKEVAGTSLSSRRAAANRTGGIGCPWRSGIEPRIASNEQIGGRRFSNKVPVFRSRTMRIAIALGALLLALAADAGTSVRAQPWCAWYDPTTYNCGFFSLQQCLATISGVGGFCRRNVWESPAYDEERPVRRKRRAR
jgi:hypothetical protein